MWRPVPVQDQLCVGNKNVSASEYVVILMSKDVARRTPPFCTASSCAFLSASYSAVGVRRVRQNWGGQGRIKKHVRMTPRRMYSRPPSLPSFLLLRKATQYHSRSSSSGSCSSSQLNASEYGTVAYSSVTGRKWWRARCSDRDALSMEGSRESVASGRGALGE